MSLEPELPPAKQTCLGCGKEIEPGTGCHCGNPECAKKAADEIAEMNAGIPTGNPEKE